MGKFYPIELNQNRKITTRNKKKLRFLAKGCRYQVDQIKEIKYFSIMLNLGFEMKKLIKTMMVYFAELIGDKFNISRTKSRGWFLPNLH